RNISNTDTKKNYFLFALSPLKGIQSKVPYIPIAKARGFTARMIMSKSKACVCENAGFFHLIKNFLLKLY
ncbi:hypothetical protein ACFLFF_31850, partial [Brevibacillus reuszeri]|uniref:hypothetical protein n=1 Tax=Brevibacillus reuszeri TaxID=54915 RepID=UPI003670065C